MMYGASNETEQQLATIFSGLGLGGYGLGLGMGFGATGFQGVDTFSYGMGLGADLDMFALGQEVRANEMLYGAAAPQTIQAKQNFVNAARSKFAQMAQARMAGMTPFDTTSERNTQVKREGCPIPPTLIAAGAGGTAGLLAPASFTFAVRPTRSQQINRIAFASGDAATAACVLQSVQILGVEQLNGAGGIPCGLYTEVMTEPNLKGGTAQAGQDILITIGNTSAVPQVIRGALFGPDLVRTT